MASKIVITAATVAAVLGAGGTALAVTGSDTTNGTTTNGTTTNSTSGHSASGHAGKDGKHRGMYGVDTRRLEHGEFVTGGKKGTVTHDVIRGSVTAVSATSISVKAKDGTTMTFTVGKDTKVRKRSDGKGAASTIGAVKTGDTVLVTGTGTSSKTARLVIDGLK